MELWENVDLVVLLLTYNFGNYVVYRFWEIAGNEYQNDRFSILFQPILRNGTQRKF